MSFAFRFRGYEEIVRTPAAAYHNGAIDWELCAENTHKIKARLAELRSQNPSEACEHFEYRTTNGDLRYLVLTGSDVGLDKLVDHQVDREMALTYKMSDILTRQGKFPDKGSAVDSLFLTIMNLQRHIRDMVGQRLYGE
jgi:hypothetical protein